MKQKLSHLRPFPEYETLAVKIMEELYYSGGAILPFVINPFWKTTIAHLLMDYHKDHPVVDVFGEEFIEDMHSGECSEIADKYKLKDPAHHTFKSLSTGLDMYYDTHPAIKKGLEAFKVAVLVEGINTVPRKAETFLNQNRWEESRWAGRANLIQSEDGDLIKIDDAKRYGGIISQSVKDEAIRLFNAFADHLGIDTQHCMAFSEQLAAFDGSTNKREENESQK